MDNFLNKPELSSVALLHLSKAYHSANVKLSSDDALSDRGIAVVISLSLLERVQRRNPRGLIHFQGLKHMVSLRGGLSRVAANRQLALKIWR